MIFIQHRQPTMLHMKSCNQTETQLFVLLCVICFQTQLLDFYYLQECGAFQSGESMYTKSILVIYALQTPLSRVHHLTA